MPRDLYSRAFEKVLFPLLDRLNHTSVVEKLAFLLGSEALDPQDVRRRQEKKLAHTLQLALEESPFYQRLWESRAGPGSEYSSLDGLPVVTKADLASASSAFPLAGFRRRAIESRTSGSTGSPMTFYRSAEQESWFWALRFRIWQWAGYHAGDPYLEINLNPRRQWKKRLQDLLFRCSYLTYNADNQDSRRIVETLQRKRIPHLNGFSSSLYVLARFMREEGIANPGVIGITSTGDSLFPAYRAIIEEAFGVRVLDYYGAGGEGVHLASQCPESNTRYHLHPENAVVEILGDDGPAPPGTPGRIVVTQLDNDAMPLIRYDLEDVAVAAPRDALCPCGRTLPLLERIEGRVPDLISVPDGTFLVPHFFVVLFKNLQSVRRYQVIQQHPERLQIRLAGRQDCNHQAVEAVVGREIQAATRDLLDTEFEWLEEIPLSASGKRRLVVSEVTQKALGSAPRDPSMRGAAVTGKTDRLTT